MSRLPRRVLDARLLVAVGLLVGAVAPAQDLHVYGPGGPEPAIRQAARRKRPRSSSLA